MDVALHEAVEKVVAVEDAGLAVARDGSGAVDGSGKGAIACLGNQLFGDPLAAVVAARWNGAGD